MESVVRMGKYISLITSHIMRWSMGKRTPVPCSMQNWDVWVALYLKPIISHWADGLAQACSNAIAKAMALLQSCTNS